MKKEENVPITEMSELDIMNFSLNFCNLIRDKNAEIGKLKSENSRLAAIAGKFTEEAVPLTVDEIVAAKRPVFVYHLSRATGGRLGDGQWALLKKNGQGVITGDSGSSYLFSNYGRTWTAFTSEIVDGPVEAQAFHGKHGGACRGPATLNTEQQAVLHDLEHGCPHENCANCDHMREEDDCTLTRKAAAIIRELLAQTPGALYPERFTYFEGGRWRLRIGDTVYSSKAVDRLAQYENTLFPTWGNA